MQSLVEQFEGTDYEEAIKKLEAENAVTAQKQAEKFLKKNEREIKRLKDHAAGAALENNFEAYKYAITKLRKMYRQPTTDEIVATMFKTTRQQIWNIVNAGTN